MKLNFWKKLRKNRFKFDMTGSLKKAKKISWKKVLIFTGYGCLGVIFLIAVAFAWFSRDLPTPSKIANQKPAQSTKIYDRTGQVLLYETGEQKRTLVQSEQISPYLKDATISVEDTNFYTHHGIEPKAIVAAIFDKLLGRTSNLRGGSTITQQYVKNALLTSDRSFIRKIKEAILAVELEFMYNKDQILTMYLNEIPYGNAAAGAEAAAKMYYGIPAKDLTLAEAATLAAIPQAPTYYSPYGTHVEKLVVRRNYVLSQMLKNGKITEAQLAEAEKQDTTTLGVSIKPRHDSILAPHFAMYVIEQVVDKYGEEKIQKQGLNIITTLDYDKQKMAESAITTGVPKLTKYGASNGALVAVDPKTGQILAMVGSKDYFDTAIDGNVNVADSLRQPGSSFKPFAYATAFKQPDFSPSRMLYDFTTDFGGGYIPHNYNNKNNGPVTMRQALSNSLNVPAVKVMSLAGIDNVLRTASDMGITTLTQRDRYGLSLVLGAGEVKPVEMAGAFSVFATGGIKHDLTSVLKITDSSGKAIYEYDQTKNAGTQVLDPQVAYEISSILTDNNARSLVFGTHTALYFPDRTVAVKTGTTSDFKDAWTMGYTPSLAVAVWTGNSDASKMKNGADGSVLAAPIFHDFVVKALANTPNEEFTKPDGIQQLTVEKYSNKLPGAYSAETTTDIFASWQVPKDQDTLHQVIKVCKGTSLIAPDGAPADLVEDMVFTDLHSERPDNPNWEGPVRAWAAANGMVATLPTEKCDTSSLAPSISIASPANGETVSGNTDITVSTKAANGVSKVQYLIDEVAIGESATSPYTFSYNFGAITGGGHKLSAIVTDDKGMTARADSVVTVSEVISVNPAISNLKIQPSATTAIVTWDTNVPTTTSISYNSTSETTKNKSDGNFTTNHTLVLSDLSPGNNYTYSMIATDSSGNTATKTGNFNTPVLSQVQN